MTRTNTYRCGLLFRLASFWIGVHYSSFDRRFCINFLPFVTFWLALPGGQVPKSANATPEPAVDSMGIPTSCGKPLCSPDAHHPLCKLHQPAAQATPDCVPQSLLMRLAGIAAECSDPDTTDALDALIAATQQATPEPASKHRPSPEWYAAMIKETMDDDFAIGPAFPATPEPVGEVVAWQRRDRNIVTGEWSEWHEDDDIEEELDPEWAERRPLFTRPAPGVPELTDAMLIAGLKECEPLGELIDWREGFGRDEMRAVWDAMLAAAQAKGGAA